MKQKCLSCGQECDKNACSECAESMKRLRKLDTFFNQPLKKISKSKNRVDKLVYSRFLDLEKKIYSTENYDFLLLSLHSLCTNYSIICKLTDTINNYESIAGYYYQI